MATIASGQDFGGHGIFVVPRPRVTDAVGGALQRCFAHTLALPDEMRRLLDRLDRATRVH